MSSKGNSKNVGSSKKSDLDKFIRTNYKKKEECIGCTYRVDRNKMKDFEKHLKVNKCDKVLICVKCDIFRSLSKDMHDEHYKTCIGIMRNDDVEKEKSSSPKHKKKKTTKNN